MIETGREVKTIHGVITFKIKRCSYCRKEYSIDTESMHCSCRKKGFLYPVGTFQASHKI